MRNWINLFEHIAVPSFVDHITDDLVDEIISSGKWVEHGTDLEDAWDQGSFEECVGGLPEEFWESSYDEIKTTPEFRKCVSVVAHNMASQAYDEIVNGNKYDKIPPLTSESILYRGIAGEFDENKPIGIFWSMSVDQAAGRFSTADGNTGGYLFMSNARSVQINWEETIRSRMDYSNGCDEAEIQLVKGSPIEARLYKVTFTGMGRPTLTFIREFNSNA